MNETRCTCARLRSFRISIDLTIVVPTPVMNIIRQRSRRRLRLESNLQCCYSSLSTNGFSFRCFHCSYLFTGSFYATQAWLVSPALGPCSITNNSVVWSSTIQKDIDLNRISAASVFWAHSATAISVLSRTIEASLVTATGTPKTSCLSSSLFQGHI